MSLLNKSILVLFLFGIAAHGQTGNIVLEKINLARAAEGKAALAPLPPALESISASYLETLGSQLLQQGECDHNRQLWGQLQSTASPLPFHPIGEVIACPAQRGYWSEQRVVDTWLNSAIHHAILVERPNSSYFNCGLFASGPSETAICITWSGPKQ